MSRSFDQKKNNHFTPNKNRYYRNYSIDVRGLENDSKLVSDFFSFQFMDRLRTDDELFIW